MKRSKFDVIYPKSKALANVLNRLEVEYNLDLKQIFEVSTAVYSMLMNGKYNYYKDMSEKLRVKTGLYFYTQGRGYTIQNDLYKESLKLETPVSTPASKQKAEVSSHNVTDFLDDDKEVLRKQGIAIVKLEGALRQYASSNELAFQQFAKAMSENYKELLDKTLKIDMEGFIK